MNATTAWDTLTIENFTHYRLTSGYLWEATLTIDHPTGTYVATYAGSYSNDHHDLITEGTFGLNNPDLDATAGTIILNFAATYLNTLDKAAHDTLNDMRTNQLPTIINNTIHPVATANPGDDLWNTTLDNGNDNPDSITELLEQHNIDGQVYAYDDGYGPYQAAWGVMVWAHNKTAYQPGGIAHSWNKARHPWRATHPTRTQGAWLIDNITYGAAIEILTAIRDQKPIPTQYLANPGDLNAAP